jgi:hypothetical protein
MFFGINPKLSTIVLPNYQNSVNYNNIEDTRKYLSNSLGLGLYHLLEDSELS